MIEPLGEKPMKALSRRKYLVLALTLGACLLSLQGLSARTVKKSTLAKPAPASASPSAATVVWDNWYTVTISGEIHYGFYNDRIELRNGGTQIYLKNEFWKQEESYIN